jgi:hypothetical protein
VAAPARSSVDWTTSKERMRRIEERLEDVIMLELELTRRRLQAEVELVRAFARGGPRRRDP